MGLYTEKDSQHLAKAISMLVFADKTATNHGTGISGMWDDTKPALFRLFTNDGPTGAAYLAISEPLATAKSVDSNDLSAPDDSKIAEPPRAAFFVLVPAALLESPIGIALLLARVRFALTRNDVQDTKTIHATTGKGGILHSKVVKSSAFADMLFQVSGLDADWVVTAPAPLDCEDKESARTVLVSGFHAEKRESAHKKFKGFASTYDLQTAWSRYVKSLSSDSMKQS